MGLLVAKNVDTFGMLSLATVKSTAPSFLILLFSLSLEIMEQFPPDEDSGKDEESIWKDICKRIDSKCHGPIFFRHFKAIDRHKI